MQNFLRPLGDISGSYNRIDMVRKGETETNLSAVWTAPTKFVVPGLNSSELSPSIKKWIGNRRTTRNCLLWVLVKITFVVQMSTVFCPVYRICCVRLAQLLSVAAARDHGRMCENGFESTTSAAGFGPRHNRSRVDSQRLGPRHRVNAISMRRLNSHGGDPST